MTTSVERFLAERGQLITAGNRAQVTAEKLDVGDDIVPEAEQYYKDRDAVDRRYRELLPDVPVSRCPITGDTLTWPLDTVDLDGWCWEFDCPVRRLPDHVPDQFLAFGGSMRIHPQPTWASFIARPGPAVPAVLPRILERPGTLAVISQLNVGQHTGWPITYWGPRDPEGVQLENDWGTDRHRVFDTDGTSLGWDDALTSPGTLTSTSSRGCVTASCSGSPPATSR